MFAWFITIRHTLGCKFSQHFFEDNCTLGNPAALLRSGIIFRDYFYNTVSSVFVQDKITSILNLQERREKQNEFISNQLCNQTVIQRILFFWDDGGGEKGRGKLCKFVFLIITAKQNPYDHNIDDRKSYNTRQNLGGEGSVGGGRSGRRGPTPRPLRSKTFIVIRLFRPSRTDHRRLLPVTGNKYSILDYLSKVLRPNRNSRVENKCKTSRRIPDIILISC